MLALLRISGAEGEVVGASIGTVLGGHLVSFYTGLILGIHPSKQQDIAGSRPVLLCSELQVVSDLDRGV